MERDRTACLEAELGEIGVSCERKKKELEGIINVMKNMMNNEDMDKNSKNNKDQTDSKVIIE